MYLRALGAKIGRGATMLTATVPVATDLITIGTDTIVRRDQSFSGYRASRRKHPDRPGHDRATTRSSASNRLDIDTAIGDGAQLGPQLLAHIPASSIPAGERRTASPAEPTDTDYRVIADAPRGPLAPVRLRHGCSCCSPWSAARPSRASSSASSWPRAAGDVRALRDPARCSLTICAVLPHGPRLDRGAPVPSAGLLRRTWPRDGRGAAPAASARPAPGCGRTGCTASRYFVSSTSSSGSSELAHSTCCLFGDSSAAIPLLPALASATDRWPQVEQSGSDFGVEVKQESAVADHRRLGARWSPTDCRS